MARVVPMLSMALLSLSGCSEGNSERLTRDDYQERILEIVGGEDAREATRLYTDSVAQTYGREQCAARVRKLHEHLEAIVEKVAEIRPPSDAEAAQRNFLAAARESVGQVGNVVDGVASGQFQCGEDLNGRLYGMPSTRRAEQAIARLEEQGYHVFGD
jgi:hypothetical protein